MNRKILAAAITCGFFLFGTTQAAYAKPKNDPPRPPYEEMAPHPAKQPQNAHKAPKHSEVKKAPQGNAYGHGKIPPGQEKKLWRQHHDELRALQLRREQEMRYLEDMRRQHPDWRYGNTRPSHMDSAYRSWWDRYDALREMDNKMHFEESRIQELLHLYPELKNF